jgi:hypothetical protein
MKKKQNSPYLWIIFGLLIIIATILVLPAISKEGSATAPTISEISETPEIYLSLFKATNFFNNPKEIFYSQYTRISDIRNFENFGIQHISGNSSNSLVNYFNPTGQMYLYTQVYLNEEIYNPSSRISKNSQTNYYYLNHYNYLANYYNMSFNLENGKKIEFSGRLENIANKELEFAVGLYPPQGGNSINTIYLTIPQNYGEFNHEIDISQIFDDVNSGNYKLTAQVVARKPTDTLGPKVYNNFYSYGFYSETFDYNGKTVSNIKATPSEDVEKFIEEEIVKKQIDILTQGKK